MKSSYQSDIDRTKWTSGPWDEEKDTYIWTDEGTGYYCLIRRNSLGALCGYVGIPKKHPLFDDEEDYYGFDCHGGVTYTGKSTNEITNEEVRLIGFDCAHLGDRLPHRLGFMMRSEDTYCDVNYVMENVTDLAKQLGELDHFNVLIKSIRDEIL